MNSYVDGVSVVTEKARPLPKLVKFNYGVGDFGNNIVWHTLGMFLAYFYTDVYGLNPVHMGTMYLVVRLFDAVTDPLVGFWVDRNRSKLGQCRPFLFYGAIPLALSFSMLFYTPDIGETGKIIYAYVSYSLLTLAYTIVNVPFSAMAGVLIQDSDERTMLQSFRFGLGMLASVFVAATVFPLVEYFGAGDEQQGYFITAVVFGCLSVICIYYCAFSVRERYSPPPLESTDKVGVGDFLGDIALALKNRQLMVLLLVNVIFIVTLMLKGATSMYYVKDVLIDAEQKLPLFMTLGTVASTLGAALSALMWTRFDKVVVYKYLLLICGLLSGVVYWMPGDEFLLILSVGLISTFLYMSVVPLTWSMVSDVVDYQHAETGKNMGGVFFALFLFSLKVGTGLGGAVVGWVLGTSGYEADGVQTVEAVQAINFISTLLPGFLFIAASVAMVLYKIDRRKREQIRIKLYGV